MKDVKRLNWRQQFQEYLPADLARGKYKQAHRLRIQMGIPTSDWFVALHVREGGFYGDAAMNGHRSASIGNYLEGIQAITRAGGWVVRLGDRSMTPLPPMERVIDYPRTSFKCDLMDLYLLKYSEFFVGCDSGVSCVAVNLFKKRAIIINGAQWAAWPGFLKGNLNISKHVFSRSRRRFLSLKELLQEPLRYQNFYHAVENDYVYYENTPEEIREVIVEFLATPPDHPYSQLQESFNSKRKNQIYEWLEQEAPFCDAEHDVSERYRIAAYCEGDAGTIGQKFIEQNWETDSYSKILVTTAQGEQKESLSFADDYGINQEG
ncbi:MAG: TIGR04372 family glycosyltransferase [Elusimicrobia bacterium]|nr:TIGR04372 family glycosyltransferase [Elusimicrobiota bacterium]